MTTKHLFSILMAYIKTHRFLFGLIVIQCIVFHGWIFSNHIFTFGDIGLYSPEAQKELFFNTQYFYVGNVDFGSVNIATSNSPLVFLYGLLGQIGVNVVWSEKLIFFYPIVFGVICTSYFLIRYITKSERGAFIGALLYSYNSYFLVTLTGALYISLAYAFVPLIFLVFLKTLDWPTLNNKLLLALLSAWLGFVEFRVFYIAFLMMAVYFIFFLYFKKASFDLVLSYVKRFILPGTLFILMNLFWVLPVILVGALTNNMLFDRELFGDGYFDMLNAIAVFHPWWTWSTPSIFVKQVAEPFLFIVPVVTAMLLFRRVRDNRIYIFFVLFLIGAFLTKQSGAPLEATYLWLYTHIPGFNAFREASKFFVVSSLGLAVLVGYFFTKIEDVTVIHKKAWRWFSIGVCAALFSIIFLNAKTIATGAIGTMFIPRDVPREYTELNNFLSNQDGFSRILWMPHTNRFGLVSNEHPAVSMLLNVDSTFANFSQDPESTLGGHLYSSFKDVNFYSLLNRGSVKYVVVPSDLVWDEVDSPWKNPENYIIKLDQIPYLTRIKNSFLEKHDIYVYLNERYYPHIYTTLKKEIAQESTPFNSVDFQFKNPTEYSVVLKNISNPVYVNFSEKYHAGWGVRIGGFDWFDVLMEGNYFLPEKYHTKNDAEFNSFLIDPEYIKKNFPNDQYHENQDGSIDLNLTLYFKPQSYFLIGALVSVSVFIFCFTVLLYGTIKKLMA